MIVLNIFNVLSLNEQRSYTYERNETVGLCAQMKFREKENKQASHDSCSKTPTYNVRAKEGNVYRM